MTIELTPQEGKFLADSIAARGYLIRNAIRDSIDPAEQTQLLAQMDLGQTILTRLQVLLIIARKEAA